MIIIGVDYHPSVQQIAYVRQRLSRGLHTPAIHHFACRGQDAPVAPAVAQIDAHCSNRFQYRRLREVSQSSSSRRSQ
jgi:hypothetical protein